MHNVDESNWQNKKLMDDAAQEEILDVLKLDGRQFAWRIAQKLGKPTSEVRWHLEALQRRGEVSFIYGLGFGV